MTPTIHAQGLAKRFGKTRALDGLDLVAEAGCVTAVLVRTEPASRPSCVPSRRSCVPTQGPCAFWGVT